MRQKTWTASKQGRHRCTLNDQIAFVGMAGTLGKTCVTTLSGGLRSKAGDGARHRAGALQGGCSQLLDAAVSAACGKSFDLSGPAPTAELGVGFTTIPWDPPPQLPPDSSDTNSRHLLSL